MITRALILSLIAIYFLGCADKVIQKVGQNGHDGTSCTVNSVPTGAVITCTDGTATVINNGAAGQDGLNGQDGSDGQDGTNGQNGINGLNGATGAPGLNAVTEIIDPCGNHAGILDEVLLRLSTGELLAYFESGSKHYLALIPDGNYVTTDAQACHFSVNGGVVSF